MFSPGISGRRSGLIYCGLQGIQFFHIKAKIYELKDAERSSKGIDLSKMCGISGVVNCGDRETLARMTHVQAHRGPDDSGLWDRKIP